MAKVQLEVEIKGGDTVEKASGKVESLRSQLRKLKEQLASGQLTGDEFAKVAQQAGQLDDKIKDVSKQVANLGSDTKYLDGFIGATQGIIGGFTAAQGAMALFGSENEDIQKSLVKVQGAVALLNGFQAVANTLQKESSAMIALSSARLKVVTFLQQRYTAAVGTATGAMKAARIAGAALGATLAATGIGALVLGISVLIPKIMEWVGATKEQRKEQEKLNAELDTTEEWTNNAIKLNDHYTKLAIERAKQRGASDAEIAAIEAKGRQKNIIETKKQYNQLKNEFENFNADKYENAKKAEEVYNDLSERMGKAYAKLQDLQNAEELSREEAKTKAIEKQRNAEAKQDKKNRDAAEKSAKEASDREKARVDKVLKQEEELFKAQQKQRVEFTEEQAAKEDEAIANRELDRINKQQEREDADAAWRAERAAVIKAEAEEQAKKQDEIERQALDSRQQILTDGLSALSNITTAFAGKTEEGQRRAFAINKALNISTTLIDTYMAAQKAYASQLSIPTPDAPVRAQVAAGISIASGLARVAAISATQFGSGSSGRGATGGGGGGGTPTRSQQPNVPTFVTNNSRQQTGGTERIKVYVTETDIRNVSNRTSSIYSQAQVE